MVFTGINFDKLLNLLFNDEETSFEWYLCLLSIVVFFWFSILMKQCLVLDLLELI